MREGIPFVYSIQQVSVNWVDDVYTAYQLLLYKTTVPYRTDTVCSQYIVGACGSCLNYYVELVPVSFTAELNLTWLVSDELFNRK